MGLYTGTIPQIYGNYSCHYWCLFHSEEREREREGGKRFENHVL